MSAVESALSAAIGAGCVSARKDVDASPPKKSREGSRSTQDRASRERHADRADGHHEQGKVLM